MIFDNGEHQLEYSKDCRDFDYTGVQCCPSCHEEGVAQYELAVVTIDGEPALLCCTLRAFFYPNDKAIGLTPEQRLLMAIFGEPEHEQEPD